MKSAKRGSYRSIHTVLVDSEEYLALPSDARLMLFVLKMRLGPIGIAVVPGMLSSLSESTGMPAERVDQSLRTLTHHGWIEISGNMIWLKNGLKYEPAYSPKNGFHLQKIISLLAALPSNPLVEKFRDYYAEYLGLERPQEPAPEPTPVPAKPKRPPAPKPPSWVAEGVAWWNENVGTIMYGRFGTALSPLVERFGWERVFEKVKWWVDSEAQEGRTVRIEWFAQNGVRLIEQKQNGRIPAKPKWQQDEEDAGIARTPGVNDRVKVFVQNLNAAETGEGDKWWEQMKQEAKAQGRHAIAYAWERMPKR